MKCFHVAFFLSLVRLCSSETGTLRGVRQKDFGESLLKELEETFGSEHSKQTEQQLLEIEDELRTTFKALPKNNRSALEGSHARYALHRFFVQRYGWQVKGLEMGSSGWYEQAGAVGVMGDRMPPKMRELFDARLRSHGFVLRDLAVLAAALGAMFRSDVYDRLSVVYAAFEHEHADVLDSGKAFAVAQAYVATLMIGKPVEQLDVEDVMVSRSAWVQFGRRDLVEGVLKNTMHQVGGYEPQKFDWQLMTSWLLAFGKQLGPSENNECQSMKHSLVELEAGKGSGLVRYSDFYSKDTNFEESLGELRIMRALDETNPDEPKVIIPNYLMGATNCISPAGHYSICCLDECEELMDKIEHHFEAPAASPKAIGLFVASLASASVPANRSLARELLEILEALAMHNGGMVPLHSNKFAKWLHHAFPRECSDPQQTDRFNQSLRYTMQDTKENVASALKAQFTNSGSTHQASNLESYLSPDYCEAFTTCLLGMVGMALAKILMTCFSRGLEKGSKEL